MIEPRTFTLKIDAERPQHALRIIEEVINPALGDWDIHVAWPDMSKPEILVTYDADDLRLRLQT